MNQNSPEFQATLNKACEEEWKGYVYGDKRKARAAEQLPESMRDTLKELQRIKRQAESISNRATSQIHRGSSGMFPLPVTPTLPENPTHEDLEQYRKEIDAYVEKVRTQAQMMRDPTIQRGVERFAAQNVGLQCPECHDTDHNNTTNGIPWCMKCNIALARPGGKLEKHRIKIIREKRVPDILRGLPEK